MVVRMNKKDQRYLLLFLVEDFDIFAKLYSDACERLDKFTFSAYEDIKNCEDCIQYCEKRCLFISKLAKKLGADDDLFSSSIMLKSCRAGVHDALLSSSRDD